MIYAGSVYSDPVENSNSGPAGATGSSSTGNSAGPRVCVWRGNVILCQTALGSWSSLASAWCRLAPTQPPISDSAWNGHTEGAIYLCTRPGFDLTPDPNLTYTRWLPSPPEANQIDPREVALQLLARLNLEAITIATFPAGHTDQRMNLVGWNTWLWAETPNQRQWGPITSSDSASGITVTLNAEVSHIEWNMGDATTLTCTKSTPWTQARTHGGKNIPSPDCGHIYQQMGTYTITATSHWNVTWTGAGQTGTLPFTLTRSNNHFVGEFQTVNS